MSKKVTNWTEVRHLLVRFYEGATTQAEESLLMHVMCDDNIPEELHTDAEVFRALAQEQLQATEIPEPSADFEQRIMARIEQAGKPHYSLARRWWTSAAACLIAILMLSPLILNRSDADADLFASSDLTQAEAEQYTAYALTLVSSKMKAGMQELDEIAKVQNQVHLTLRDAFKE